MSDHATDEHVQTTEEEHIHMPGPSVWPFALSFFLTLAMGGLMTWERASLAITGIIVLIGAAGMAASIILWGIQISEA